jgi:dTDP-4-dehydrorhamnose reductase
VSVVNVAAYTDVNGAETNCEMALAISATTPEILVQWVAKHAAAMVRFLSDYVSNGHRECPWREQDQSKPLNVCGEIKAAGDQAVIKTLNACHILRMSWVYAAHGRNFLLTMLGLGKKRKELWVVNDQLCAAALVTFLADTLTKILGQADRGVRTLFSRNGGIVYATGSGKKNWHGIAEANFISAQQNNYSLKIKNLIAIGLDEYPLPTERPRNFQLSLTALQESFGVQTPHWAHSLEVELDKLKHLNGGSVAS